MDLDYYKSKSEFTCEDMCELVSYFWKDIKYRNLTPKEIWHYLPNGEICILNDWFEEAELFYKLK